MKLAHIVPISLLSAVPNEQSLHLVLSELVLSNNAYRDFYRDRSLGGDTIILDNPVHENRPVTIARWIEAIRVIQPNIAVIPDVIDSDRETLTYAHKAVAQFQKSGFTGIELMAVPHGNSQPEWLACATRLAKIGPPVTWFGISLERRLKDDMEALRRRRERVHLMLDYRSEFSHINLHLLGVSERGDELGDDYIWNRATSADASKYAVWNMVGTPVTPPVPVNRPYPGRGPFGGSYEYFTAEAPTGVSIRRMRSNLRKWTNYANREFT